MLSSQPLPSLWLVSDARNDAVLERALHRLPRGSGFIFRHYHLPDDERRASFRKLARVARACGHCVILAGTPKLARRWGADGSYGSRGAAIAAVHSLRELAKAQRVDAVLLSPVFQTRSHPGGTTLGAVRFLLLARRSRCPVIALGGMNPARARQLGAPRWAAIDGLIPKDS